MNRSERAGRIREALASSCPPPHELMRRWEQNIGRDAHVESCALCSAHWRHIEEFHRGEPAPSEAPVVEEIVRQAGAPRPSRQWTRILGIAAMLAVVVALTVQWRAAQLPDLPQRVIDGPLRSVASLSPAPAGDLAAPPDLIVWAAAPDAASYELTLAEVDDTVLWKANVTQAEAAVPEDIRRRMLPRKTLVWTVVARAADGRELTRSQPTRFRVLP